jgi:hypothetical protein
MDITGFLSMNYNMAPIGSVVNNSNNAGHMQLGKHNVVILLRSPSYNTEVPSTSRSFQITYVVRFTTNCL